MPYSEGQGAINISTICGTVARRPSEEQLNTKRKSTSDFLMHVPSRHPTRLDLSEPVCRQSLQQKVGIRCWNARKSVREREQGHRLSETGMVQYQIDVQANVFEATYQCEGPPRAVSKSSRLLQASISCCRDFIHLLRNFFATDFLLSVCAYSASLSISPYLFDENLDGNVTPRRPGIRTNLSAQPVSNAPQHHNATANSPHVPDPQSSATGPAQHP